jgi:hypothetical protein
MIGSPLMIAEKARARLQGVVRLYRAVKPRMVWSFTPEICRIPRIW